MNLFEMLFGNKKKDIKKENKMYYCGAVCFHSALCKRYVGFAIPTVGYFSSREGNIKDAKEKCCNFLEKK